LLTGTLAVGKIPQLLSVQNLFRNCSASIGRQSYHIDLVRIASELGLANSESTRPLVVLDLTLQAGKVRPEDTI